jgi:F0F1-type ATP synthase membrane subunit b/b'
MILRQIWWFAKKSWEWVALGVATLLGVFLYGKLQPSDPVFDERDRRAEREIDRQEENADDAREAKRRLEREYDRLRDEQRDIEAELSREEAKRRFTDKEDLRRWFDQEFGR